MIRSASASISSFCSYLSDDGLTLYFLRVYLDDDALPTIVSPGKNSPEVMPI